MRSAFLGLFLAVPLAAAPSRPDPAELAWIDLEVQRAIAGGLCPGAVVLVGTADGWTWCRAFGQRAVQPAPEAMTTDTVFDLASVTKPVATATAVMVLVEAGRLALDDPVCRHLPEFRGLGKEGITVAHLLTHHGGLTPDNPLTDYQDGREKAWERICGLPLLSPPGREFRYSDVGFIVLGRLVERVAGVGLDDFTTKRIFRPLGMASTGFTPPAERRSRISPTEIAEEGLLRGIVHDPRARLLGGTAGHAGLFAPAGDLGRFCRMLLQGGTLDGSRVLGQDTVKRMVTALPDASGRALGWDVASAYASPRGRWLTPGVSFGHSGFTGTSLWIDPAAGVFVVFLSSRLHPDGKGNVLELRRRVGDAAGRALGLHLRGTLPGVEVLARDGFRALKGARVGLVTNHTGRTRDGRATIDLLARAPGVQLLALFAPEHGIRGDRDERLGHGRDERTGLPVWSLYGETRRPTAAMLRGLDTLVFDIQDIGCRFYTYISTLLHCLEEAARHRLRLVVLDRPNPIGGHRVFGPLPDKDRLGFTACAPIPLVHGMTVGELAILFNRMNRIGARLEVVRTEGWRREQWLDQTDIPWVDTSPNMRSLAAAALYPGVGLLEATNLSMGRGTATPFEHLGAPWIDGEALAAALRTTGLSGLAFQATTFTPEASAFAGRCCRGVAIEILDREAFDPVRLGVTLAQTLRRLHGEAFQAGKVLNLLRNAQVQRRLEEGLGWDGLAGSWAPELEHFLALRKEALLYR